MSRRVKSKAKYRQQRRQNERTVLKLGTRMRVVELEKPEDEGNFLVHPFSWPGGRR